MSESERRNQGRTFNSLRNVKVSMICQCLGIMVSFLLRRVFVSTLSSEYLGVHGTFTSILSMLSLAELGVGSAISYSLYKPIAENNRDQICALMQLYRKVYFVIGCIVFLLGGVLTPLLQFIVKDLPELPNIRLIFFLFVVNSASSYFFTYKQSLITATQNKYIVSLYHYGLNALMYLVQALFLLISKNYILYLVTEFAFVFIRNVLLAKKADKLFPEYVKTTSAALEEDTRKSIIRNTKAMMAHRLGGVVVLGTDNLLISYFVGVISTGLYSNYRMVTSGLGAVLNTVFHSLTASVGNLGATEDHTHALLVFQRVDFAARWLFGFSAICLVVLFNPFIELWVGREYLFDEKIVLIIAINYYLSGMRQSVLTFRDAYGLYWYDRWKPVAEIIINLTSSVLLARVYGVLGILLGTLISTVLTCFWMEPYVLYKHALRESVKGYFLNYIIGMLKTIIVGIIAWYICKIFPDGEWKYWILKCLICAILTNLLFVVAFFNDASFGYYLKLGKKLIKK